MALSTLDQHQSNLKHFCKICKKGFGCGRALGGHMRAHGMGEDSWTVDDDEDAESDWDEKQGDGGGGNVLPSTRHMYALRTNPNRLKPCRVCENCGKEFLSWNSFFEHGNGKCSSSDHMESPVSSPTSDGDGDGDDDIGQRGCGSYKRKRSVRTKVGTLNSICPLSEEDDLAVNCLMMLSNGSIDPLAVTTVAEPEESSASASRDEERRNTINFITPISYCVPAVVDHKAKTTVVPKGLFECKACKKIFNSHQALGGHRASHKKVKGCFASRLDQLEDKDDDVITHEEFLPTKSNSVTHHDHSNPSNNNGMLLMASSSKKKSKVHECSICHRIFSSGQALGGHKRCHWITPNAPATSTLARFQQFQDHMERMNRIPKFDNSSEPIDLKLDLNLPAPLADELARRTEIFLQPWLGGTTKQKDQNNNNNTNTHTNSQCHSPINREVHHHHGQHHHENENDNEDDKNNKNNSTVSMENVEDEADSKVKLAKLSELKDMNIGGSSSPWLQVGISSTTGVGAEP